jgi:hypothetical protein
MLAALLDSEKVVHVRGPPASGKSELAKLLKDHYIEKSRRVFFVRLWTTLLDGFVDDAWDRLAERFHGFASQTVIIIDEAQLSYTDSNLWNVIIKELLDGTAPVDIEICLFCSYGSPLTGVDVMTGYYSPGVLKPTQRVTLAPHEDECLPRVGLFFTMVEFNDVVSRMIRYIFQEQFTLDEEAASYIFSFTNGHPGGVSSVMEYIYHVRFRKRVGSTLDWLA